MSVPSVSQPSIGAKPGLEPLPSICIVTPDIIGPVRNGGIGTHCYWLARLLRSRGIPVTVLFTGPYEGRTLKDCQELYEPLGIEFCDLSAFPPPPYTRNGCEWFVERSLQVFEFLKSRSFSQVHFQEWQANGFHSVQAKRCGLAFGDTQLIVTLHSPSRWAREGMRQWAENPVRDLMLDYCEQYAAEHADTVISPSQHMLDWVRTHGWQLPKNTLRVPYVLSTDHGSDANETVSSSPSNSQALEPDLSHIAFFGRLETRKGFEIFLDGVERAIKAREAATDNSVPLRQVSLVGKFGVLASGQQVQERIEQFAKRLNAANVSLHVHTQFDSSSAVQHLKDTRAIVFVCSLQDNLPFTVLECLSAGLPILATSVGGIPEMLAPARLFEPTPAGVCNAVLHMLHNGSVVSRSEESAALYDASQAQQSWLSIARGQATSVVATPKGASAAVCSPAEATVPALSVCVAHYNYGKYLPQLLESLARSDCDSFEVIVVDDGSTEQRSLDVFEQQRGQFEQSRGWRFIRKKNEGIGATRNFAASQARGELLVFVDADNIALPSMLSQFRAAMHSSGADCLTCHYLAFEGDAAPAADFSPVYGYVPIGPCVSVGAIANVFGDANFCVRRDVFQKLGGFSTERTSSFEDWEFLARLSLAGWKQDVIPEVLFLYRHVAGGFSRTTSAYANQNRVMDAYRKCGASLNVGELMQTLVFPLYNQVRGYEMAGFQHRRALKLALQIAGLGQKFPALKRALLSGAEALRAGIERTRARR